MNQLATAADDSSPQARLDAGAARLALARLNVLIVGETGVGKGFYAEYIHQHSPHSTGPFVRLNCGALAPEHLGSHLFGTEYSSGLVERAHGGTLFLDNVSELPLTAQARLCRVVESGGLRREKARPSFVSVRFIAATSQAIEAQVEAGLFRADLYFRIAAATLAIPPLRERREGTIALAEQFIAEAAARYERRCVLTADARRWIASHTWPGNAHELRAACERAVLLVQNCSIEKQHLVQTASWRTNPLSEQELTERRHTGRIVLSNDERSTIVETLKRFSGNQTRAAAVLGIGRRTLVSRLNEYGIPRPRQRRTS